MIYFQIGTWFRTKALSVLTNTNLELFLTGWLTEISGWPTYIVYVTFKFRILCDQSGFLNDGFVASNLNCTSLMKC